MSNRIELQPYDEANQRLEAAVRPPEWRNPLPEGRYNLVVIGAGTAGLVTAAVAAGLGGKVALVERNLMGGDCLNVGCVPSKGILSAARAVAAVRKAGHFGVSASGEASVDFAEVMRRMRALRADISPADSARRFRDEKGVDIFFGEARFIDSSEIAIGGARLQFSKAVIATGAQAAAPPIPGLDRIDYLTNESLFSLTEQPRSLGVIGAGPIGCEMAQAFARFGSEVALIEATHGILPREDRDAAEVVKASMIRDGVRLLCCGKEMRLSPTNDGKVRMQGRSHEASYDQIVEKLLVVVGRAPNVETLNLEAVGIDYDARTGVHVDDRFRTTNPKIYAAGDVCSSYKFTHAADFMARTVVRNALFRGRSKASSLVIPWATYTSPELAHVGLSEGSALEQGVAIETFRQDFSEVDRAILDGETEGFVKVHVRKGTEKIVGATIVSPHAGDLISQISLAMTAGIGLGRIANVIHPYPTQAEAIRKTGDLFNRTKLTPTVQKLFSWWLARTR